MLNLSSTRVPQDGTKGEDETLVSSPARAYFFVAIILFLVSFAVSANACIDINTAPPEELEKIRHIGESRAKQIITLRGEKLFFSVDGLDRVVGIGPARISDIKQEGLACVSPQQELQPITTAPSLEIRSPTITYPSGIIINEILPSPEGADETEEWIEIFNQNDFEVDLAGWQIRDTIGKTNTYTFPVGIKISATGFLVLTRPETKIVLNNDADGLSLIRPDGKILDFVNYEKAPPDQSYNLTNSGWVWSNILTPGAINIGPNPANKEGEKGIEREEKGLAAVSESVDKEQNSRNFYPFLAAFGLAIFSGVIILMLKKKLIE